ncbi:transposase domain-containing protein [Candidatus Riflebacteria bacterium]
METAKANNLEPFSYLKFLFEIIPVTPDSDFQKLLPNRVNHFRQFMNFRY